MKISRLAIAATAVLAATGVAHADDDGGASNCVSFIVGFCNDIDVANNAISTQEILNGTVKQEDLDGDLNGKINSIAGKANAADVYDKSTVDNKLNGKANKSDVYTKNQVDSQNAVQNFFIGANYVWDGIQQHQIDTLKNTKVNKSRLDNFNGTGGSLEHWADGVDSAISSHSALLSQHSATLAHHGERLDSQAKGIAIATAMPDTWLQPHEKFAIAGGLGGFDSEAAVAFAAIGRIDGTWSLNAGLGSDVEFKEFGWKVGARAGW